MKILGFILLLLFVSSTGFTLQMNEPCTVLATAMDGGINDIDYVVLDKAKRKLRKKGKKKNEKIQNKNTLNLLF